MATYLSPGVYTREIDFSFYVKQISTSSCGMVGVAERGPINKPVLVTSWEQFINKFGSYLQAGYLAYAARAFFDNGGSVLYVNRIAHLSDPTDRDSLTAVRPQRRSRPAPRGPTALPGRHGRPVPPETASPSNSSLPGPIRLFRWMSPARRSP
jgi:phage tail sheath protein FI